MAANTNMGTLAGAKALIAGIDARLDEINAQGGRLAEEFTTLDARIRDLLKRLNALDKERKDLEALKRRYQGRPAKGEVKETIDERPGATAAILSLLSAAPNRQLPTAEVVQRIEAGIRSGAIRTKSADARKLASSVVGNLVRQGRLLSQVHRDGEVVILVENGQQKHREDEDGILAQNGQQQ